LLAQKTLLVQNTLLLIQNTLLLIKKTHLALNLLVSLLQSLKSLYRTSGVVNRFNKWAKICLKKAGQNFEQNEFGGPKIELFWHFYS
jgi:hypothetical protein